MRVEQSVRAVAFAAALCVACTETAVQSSRGDDAFQALHDRYVIAFLDRNPVVSTYLGGVALDPSIADTDGRLRDHSPEALQVEDRELQATLDSLELIDTTTLTAVHRIDREVMASQLRFLLHQHQVRRYQERALDTYTDEPFRGVDWQLQGMTQTGDSTYGTDEEWTRVAERLEAIPAYFETARRQLAAGDDLAALQRHNRAAVADLAAHEGFPGHDWHYKVMTLFKDEISWVRWLTPGSVEDSSSEWEDSMAADGCGLYAEALMAEPLPTDPDGFYTNEERLYQLRWQLLRDLRVRIDTGIHTGRMGLDEAVDLFSQVVDFLPGSCADDSVSESKRASCDSSRRAIFRYSKWPTQAITYRLGKEQIFALRKEVSDQLGERFSLQEFHLAFMKQGTIPVGYFHDEFLRELTSEPVAVR